MPADAGIRFGQYVLVRRIARGGMAEVFLAQQRGLEGFDRRVAVKRILPHLADSPDFVKMFLSEARLAAQLSHPNVVHIYEFGKVEHDYFIAMEFVDGVHAGQMFKHGETERLPVTLVARIGADAANALNYAHELRGPNGKSFGLVHRDVSPANIMISYDGVVKLCDFGIAKAAAAGDQLTNPGQVKGKYAYMSPEQTIAAPLDGRSDVFALAIVLWELLSGKYIVPRGDAVASMRMIRDGKLEPLEKVAPHVPPALVKAINWALEPKRENRATAVELAQALEAFIKSSPELATSMQLSAWIRSRFGRETDGQETALDPNSDAATPHPGTQVSPGTVAAPGTAAGASAISSSEKSVFVEPQSAPMTLPPTPPMYPPRRVVKLIADTTEGTEIYSTSDLQDAMTVKAPKFSGNPPAFTPSSPTMLARPDAEPTVQSGPPMGVGDATEIVEPRHMPAPDEEDSQNMFETVLHDRRSPIPSGPTVVPTRLQPSVAPSNDLAATAVPQPSAARASSSAGGRVPPSGPRVAPSGAQVPPSGARVPPSGAQSPQSGERAQLHLSRDSRTSHTLKGTGTQAVLPRPQSSPSLWGPGRSTPVPHDDGARARRRKQILMFSGLAGLALLSFMIALAASNTGSSPVAAKQQDASVPVVEAIHAALPLAEPPLDAAHLPTVPVDATAAAMGLLVVRTIPDGGIVKVGDQVREAAVQPGDPTGARTAQLLLEAGPYRIEAELAGYQAEKRDIVLEGGENKMIEITFSKKTPRQDRGQPTGKLTVKTSPWSDVYLAGKKLGQAPFTDLDVPTGTYTLTFKNPSRPTTTKSVTIKAGKVTKLNFSLP